MVAIHQLIKNMLSSPGDHIGGPCTSQLPSTFRHLELLDVEDQRFVVFLSCLDGAVHKYAWRRASAAHVEAWIEVRPRDTKSDQRQPLLAIKWVLIMAMVTSTSWPTTRNDTHDFQARGSAYSLMETAFSLSLEECYTRQLLTSAHPASFRTSFPRCSWAYWISLGKSKSIET